MNEFKKIERIKKILGKNSSDVLIGIGDDAAVVRWKSPKLVVTTDCQVEDVHFSLRYAEPQEIGHRLLAVSLSDIAAMGAVPKVAVVSLAFSESIDDKFIEKMYRGMGALARKAGVEIVGGNLSASTGKAFFDLTLMGELDGKPMTRGGANAGDFILCSGALGDSAAGFAALQKWGKAAKKKFPSLTKAHLTPTPSSEFGVKLGKWATSCLDVSDGLSSELNHLSKAAKLAFVVQEALIPVSASAQNLGEVLRKDPLQWALHGGENYGLLFTVPREHLEKVQRLAFDCRVALHAIGMVAKRKPEVLLEDDAKTTRLLPKGWTHF
jgi:thiamine-monophosphate kinase